MSFVHDKEASEDILQGVMVKIWQHSDDLYSEKFANDKKRRGWVFRIAQNESRNYLAYLRRKMRDKTSPMTGVEVKIVDFKPTPEQLITDQEFVDKTIQAMPDIHQEIVKLAIQGLSIKEISEKLSLPEGTVLSRLHRVREKLYK